ncbi:MAG: N-acetylneuraminate synthase family protein [Pirellulales bacterium]
MSSQTIKLTDRRQIGPDEPTLVVAEIGQNHNGQLAMAAQLIDAAAWAGVDAVKVVKRDLGCELTDDASRRPYHSPHAFGPTYGEHRAALELSADEHAALAERAREHGLLYIGTACDAPSADLLAALGVDAFKIASRDLANLPLLENIAGRGRPLLLSTGMSDLCEIDVAVGTLRQLTGRFVLMQCTSQYPTPYRNAHLRSIPTLARRYGALTGFSDHTQGTSVATAAVALGAVVVEKHLTLDRTLRGSDHACSLEPDELREWITNIRQVEAALGRADKPLVEEVAAVREKLGRSLVAREPLAAGTVIDEAMLALKSPGAGLSWYVRGRLVGQPLRRNVNADELLTLDDVA